MTRLVVQDEPIRDFTAVLEGGERFIFFSTYRESWAKAERLAAGRRLVRVERITALSRSVQERT